MLIDGRNLVKNDYTISHSVTGGQGNKNQSKYLVSTIMRICGVKTLFEYLNMNYITELFFIISADREESGEDDLITHLIIEISVYQQQSVKERRGSVII